MSQPKSVERYGLPLLNFLLSTVGAFVTSITPLGFTVPQSIIFGVAAFTALSLIELSFHATTISEMIEPTPELRPIRDDTDALIQNIHRGMRTIMEGAFSPQDKFFVTLKNELMRLEKRIRDAADKQELIVEEDHFNSAAEVLGAFAGDKDPVYRFTWAVYTKGPIFNIPAWEYYFRLAIGMLERKELHSMRIIVLVPDPTYLDEKNIQALLDFFHSTERLEYRVVARDYFRLVANDAHIPVTRDDFGIYSDKMLYTTESETPPYTHGKYTKDRETIRAYSEVFRTLWAVKSILHVPRGTAQTLEEVILIDEVGHLPTSEPQKLDKAHEFAPSRSALEQAATPMVGSPTALNPNE